MNKPTERIIKTNGIRLNVLEQGEGPLVVLCHGFPESSYSWRHQMEALAAAGFRAVAPDMRGYGKSDQPDAVEQYTTFHMVGDLVGLLDALEIRKAVVVGHDWGAAIAWQAARLRPDRFHAVVCLSVPYRPRGPAPPTTLMPQTADAQFYQLYFQEPGVAEAELERDPSLSLRTMLYGASGEGAAAIRALIADGKAAPNAGMIPRGSGVLQGVIEPPPLPSWLSEADVEFYAGEFARGGFRAPLNYYRNVDRNWELAAAFADVKVTVPALYIAGDHDMVLAAPGTAEYLANLRQFVPLLREIKILPGCGHWTQQERPTEVSIAMINFLRDLPN
ncbi:pimeloyl-ACP methyl ester carboxylesterase [Bradyrhizobium sp. USDA 4524]|uniref:alpha/beta fold hydrolase n=1 Tax=unclassified Bradyrhizobium TaxID=2631580 RepID=UPI0020A04D20|nr:MULTISPECIES: alpha/beta hydrolase [unclassified Bradyrhizobium]MCP1845619.1 pimeloyl-ACP methyl ester carboxylesterase [Bradyrhizobium sp. USDA 4538]MCP1907057.1 pimeloyl-ACP methyl ester carboxylesterase [Bradyrhizobium sp. USDA 4537]MCP1985533.1 pimeloyl-ACP methyl ester carboxylesterase [Bradyrhizobium sp. USDA 4539]